ncbi:MAG: MFS transporter [Sphaerochaetaceae bacterium]
MKNRNYIGFLWHAVFLSLTTTFTEVNTVIPALILSIGGSSIHVGIVSAIVIGLPVVTKLFFSSFLSSRKMKKPYLLLGINLRILALISIVGTLIWYQSFSFFTIIILLYLELLIFSVGGAFASLPYVYLLGKFQRKNRIKFFTRRQMISSLGMLLSVIIARYILSRWEYPTQYVILFSLSAISLFIASFGFWIVKEKPRDTVKKVPILVILKNLPKLLKKDRDFFKFLIYSNIMGAAIALIPFYIGYAKKMLITDSSILGSVLFVQIMGMFVSSFIYPKVINTKGFKEILRLRIIFHSILPILAIFIVKTGSIIGYLGIFFLIGFAISARAVSENAALIELSNDENRVIYSALAGTLNISIIVFPLVLGFLISIIGYPIVFISSAIITLLAFPVLKSLNCPIDAK